MTIPAPTLCRLEYWGAQGWVVGHAAMALLNPQAYVDKLVARDRYSRATALDDLLQPTGTVYEPDGADVL